MPVDALVAVNRVVGRSMASVAAASREVVVALLGARETSGPTERAAAVALAVEALAPQMEQVLAYAYEEHVRELVRAEAGTALVDEGVEGDVREVAIGFADLVGFTSLGDESSPVEAGRVAEQLEELAARALRPQVAVVKTIGDEVMLASPDADALVATLLHLLAAVDEPGLDLPQLRAGAAAGPALRRAGDWYGRTVNLASRLASAAEPGQLVGDATLRARASARAAWHQLGSRPIKGFAQPIALFAATTSRTAS